MNTKQQVIILSAELLGHSENAKRTQFLENSLTDIGLKFAKGLGVYKGNLENSFVVLVDTIDEIETLKAIAFQAFKQESVLHQDSNGLASLVFNNGTTQTLGKLIEVPESEAVKQDAYTILKGKFYTTR